MKLKKAIGALVVAMTAGTAAHAAVVTFTFDSGGALSSAAANGSNGTAAPNITGITAGYYSGGAVYSGGSIGYYGGNGFGVTSPSGCGVLPADTATAQYRCKNGSDAHYVDNDGNGARIEVKIGELKAGRQGTYVDWGDWEPYSSVKVDDFAGIAFDTDVIVTSVTLGLWDWNSSSTGQSETYCSDYYERGEKKGQCKQWGTRELRSNSIDVDFNVDDALKTSAWTTMLAIDVGADVHTGDSFVINIGSYAPNDWFGIGAGFGLSGTGFKVLALTVETPDTPPDEIVTLSDCGTAGPCAVPEPGTLSSLGLGALAMGFVGWRRRSRAKRPAFSRPARP